MKTWSEVREQIEQIDPYDTNDYYVATALKDLTEWLDEYFVGIAVKK